MIDQEWDNFKVKITLDFKRKEEHQEKETKD